MRYEELVLELKKNDFKYDPYVYLAIEDKYIRDQLIENITGEYHINIYYNSYYLVNAASKKEPSLFYEYWDALVPLLTHKNSYHRSIGHWILTNLVKVDIDHKFDAIKDTYFSMIKDVKFQTGLMALRDIISISQWREDLKIEIIDLFLNKEVLIEYKDNQVSKMEYEIITYLSNIDCDAKTKLRIKQYVIGCLDSKTNTTRILAKKVLKQLEE